MKGANVSRIGKKPIAIDEDIKVNITSDKIHLEGPQGKMDVSIPTGFNVVQTSTLLEVKPPNTISSKMHGLFRTLLQNAVIGVKKQWSRNLELIGVGYRAQTDGKELVLNLGFSHPVKIQAPENVTFKVSENKISVLGADKYLVGETAATIRRIKPPEPYKGKGIRFEGEFIRKKLGKAAKAVGAASAK